MAVCFEVAHTRPHSAVRRIFPSRRRRCRVAQTAARPQLGAPARRADGLAVTDYDTWDHDDYELEGPGDDDYCPLSKLPVDTNQQLTPNQRNEFAEVSRVVLAADLDNADPEVVASAIRDIFVEVNRSLPLVHTQDDVLSHLPLVRAVRRNLLADYYALRGAHGFEVAAYKAADAYEAGANIFRHQVSVRQLEHGGIQDRHGRLVDALQAYLVPASKRDTTYEIDTDDCGLGVDDITPEPVDDGRIPDVRLGGLWHWREFTTMLQEIDPQLASRPGFSCERLFDAAKAAAENALSDKPLAIITTAARFVVATDVLGNREKYGETRMGDVEKYLRTAWMRWKARTRLPAAPGSAR